MYLLDQEDSSQFFRGYCISINLSKFFRVIPVSKKKKMFERVENFIVLCACRFTIPASVPTLCVPAHSHIYVPMRIGISNQSLGYNLPLQFRSSLLVDFEFKSSSSSSNAILSSELDIDARN